MAQNPADCSAKLVGLADPVKGKEFPLSGVIKVGRDQKTSNLTVSHASVSRHHAQITQDGGAWVVEDLNSTNGIFVNDAKIPKARLKDGDVLRVGDIPLKFVVVQSVTQVVPKREAEDDMTMQSTPRPVLPAAAPPPAAPQPPPPAPAPVAAKAAPPPPPPAPPPPAPVAAKPAPPPPAPPPPAPVAAKPAAPPPAPRPAPAPAKPAASTGEAGADLFEPSIIGGNIGAALAAGAGQAAPAPAKPAAAAEPEFEGTMYGPQVARQLVKAIREEKQDEAEASAKGIAAKLGVAGAARGPKTPSFFWLKIKFFVFLLLFFGLVGGGVYWAKLSGEKEDVFRKAKSEVKIRIEKFGREDEEKSTHSLTEQLTTLTELDSKLKELITQFQSKEKWVEELQALDSRVSFLIFERKVGAAVDARNLKDADQVIEDMSAKGTPEQRDLMPMVKLAARYEVFGAKYADPPTSAADGPGKAEVFDLAACNAEFVKQYRNKGKEVEAQFKLISRMVTEADGVRERLVAPWNTCWTAVDAYEKAKTPEKLEDLKKTYPKLKMIQDLK